MQIVHTTLAGKRYPVQIDESDLPFFSSKKWRYTPQGLIEVLPRKKRGEFLHRLLMGAELGQAVRRLDGNPFNVQRENLWKRYYGVRRLPGQKNKPFLKRSGDLRMCGVSFGGQRKHRYCHASINAHGKRLARRFLCSEASNARDRPGIEETYRRAVCWRIGMSLVHGFRPEPRSMEIFHEQHPVLCPFPWPEAIGHQPCRSVYRVVVRVDGKVHRKDFSTTEDQEDALCRAVFWRAGMLFVHTLRPDVSTVAMIERMFAMCDAPVLPEEMYSGNDDYRGSRAYDNEDAEDDQDREDGDEEEDRFNTGSVPCGSTSFFG